MKKHTFGIFITLLIVGFFTLALFQKDSSSADDTPSANIAVVDHSSPMSIGDEDAPVSIIQYSDMLCPQCSYFSTQIMPYVHDEYIEPGIVQFEFRPMAFVSPESTNAGAGAFCAADQGDFWSFHDSIYTEVATRIFIDGLDPTKNSILPDDKIKQVVATTSLDSDDFNTCLDERRNVSDIQLSTVTANKNGIHGTPYILVNGEEWSGAMTFDALSALIDASL